MTTDELLGLLTESFYDDFADTLAARVCGAEAVGILYSLITSPGPAISREIRHKVQFRGAYVLEKIYFGYPDAFGPYTELFYEDFPNCADPSARRHFTKMMAHLLHSNLPSQEVLERIADAAAQWAIDPEAKVAVRIGAVEVLKCCRERIGWVAQTWPDLLAAMQQGATPGINSRMRSSWTN